MSDARRRTLAAARFELRGEECAPPLPPGERVGGTALLRDQSLCPFRAFAMHRLRASALDSPQTGLDPLQRGSLVHGLLERLWARVDDRRGLAALGDAGRRALVRELVQAETLEAARRRPRAFPPRLVEIENQRLEALLLEWLDCELARPDFRVVAREQRATLQVGGLRIRGRIDRTDELADGRRLVIDYKTGAAAPGDWLGDRPRDLQLPLYGMHFGAAAVAGLALAQVRARQCTWRGVVRDEGTLAGAEVAGQWKAAGGADWDTLSAQWQATAERLAGEFLAGRAEVDPLPQACRYCHLQALCRVHERSDRQQADPGGEGDGLD